MTDDGIITNRMLLEHIQAGDNALKQELKELKKEVTQGFQRIDSLEERFDHLEHKMDQKFEEARAHREAIQEDLYATIKMQAGHERELAVLTGRPMPEDY